MAQKRSLQGPFLFKYNVFLGDFVDFQGSVVLPVTM